jgi:hypothetical protein
VKRFVLGAVVLLALALLTLLSVGVGAAAASTVVYADNQPGWEAAATVWQTEDFNDAALNSNISVVTD